MQRLHDLIIAYVTFLRSKSLEEGITDGLLQSWFMFPEVRQNWLGFSKRGNGGSGLGMDFALALNRNLRTVFTNFGAEEITKGSHLEKLCLIKDGIGRDNISDFTTNLIKDFLLRYTQTFALTNISSSLRRKVTIQKVAFNYETETWRAGTYELPFAEGDYVILTPKDILTKDDTWISRGDMLENLHDIATAIPDAQLRSQISRYFLQMLSRKSTRKDERGAAARVVGIQTPTLLVTALHPSIRSAHVRRRTSARPLVISTKRRRVSDAAQKAGV